MLFYRITHLNHRQQYLIWAAAVTTAGRGNFSDKVTVEPAAKGESSASAIPPPPFKNYCFYCESIVFYFFYAINCFALHPLWLYESRKWSASYSVTCVPLCCPPVSVSLPILCAIDFRVQRAPDKLPSTRETRKRYDKSRANKYTRQDRGKVFKKMTRAVKSMSFGLKDRQNKGVWMNRVCFPSCYPFL